MAFLVYELVQNALDSHADEVNVSLERQRGTKYCWLSVEDNCPTGMVDLQQAWVLFGRSTKADEAERRGRFCVGEKLVLSLCEEASITSTSGGVKFDQQGRKRTKARRDRGTVFRGRIKLTEGEVAECVQAVQRILVPTGVRVTCNGLPVPNSDPIRTFQASLPTELADAEGVLRRAVRQGRVELHGVLGTDAGWLFEMGIPIVETGDPWHVNVCQKVPVPLDRDSVTPAYLARVRAAVLGAASDLLSVDTAAAGWVRDALEHHGKGISDDVLRTVMRLRLGERAVSHDPSDPEASKRAVAAGYHLVHGSSLSAEEWALARSVEAVRPASAVTPSPKPFSPGGQPLSLLPREKWTFAMCAVVSYVERVSPKLIARPVQVLLANDAHWPFRGTYGDGVMTLNVGRLGRSWFEGPMVMINDLILHELGHSGSVDHLSEDYYRCLTLLGAKLTQLALDEPETFDLGPRVVKRSVPLQVGAEATATQS